MKKLLALVVSLVVFAALAVPALAVREAPDPAGSANPDPPTGSADPSCVNVGTVEHERGINTAEDTLKSVVSKDECD